MFFARSLSTRITKKVGEGEFYCPVCATTFPHYVLRGDTSRYTVRRVSRYFSFLAVPLIKTSVLGEYVCCERCKTQFPSEILRLSRGQIEKAAEPWDCSACGKSNPFTAARCLSCRAPRPARPLVSTAPPGPSSLPAERPAPPPLAAGLDPWQVITTRPAVAVPKWRVIVVNLFRAYLACFAVLVICTDGKPEKLLDKVFGSAGKAEFKEADALIDNEAVHQAANGNSPEAVALAGQLAQTLTTETMAKLHTLGKNDIFDKNADKFLVFCQLNKDSCVFLIHVPWIHFAEDPEKKSIAENCYQYARAVLAASRAKSISHLIVSTRGWGMYTNTLEGNEPPGTPADISKLVSLRTDEDGSPDLYHYFAPHSADKSPANTAGVTSSTPPTTPIPSTPTARQGVGNPGSRTVDDRSPKERVPGRE